MEESKIFVPHELKTIEIDVEKKIFRVNGEDFGNNCTAFSINCETQKYDEWFRVYMRAHADVKYANYDINGMKTKEQQYQSVEIKEGGENDKL